MRNILRMIQMRWWCDVSSDEKINLLVTSLTRALPWIFPSSSSPKFTCIFNRIKMYWKSVSVDPNLRLRTKANYSVILGVAVLCISHLHMPGNKKIVFVDKKKFSWMIPESSDLEKKVFRTIQRLHAFINIPNLIIIN